MATATQLTTFHYIVVMEDGQEVELDAIGNEQAIGLCQRQYPNTHWQLFRINGGEREAVCMESPDCKK